MRADTRAQLSKSGACRDYNAFPQILERVFMALRTLLRPCSWALLSRYDRSPAFLAYSRTRFVDAGRPLEIDNPFDLRCDARGSDSCPHPCEPLVIRHGDPLAALGDPAYAAYSSGDYVLLVADLTYFLRDSRDALPRRSSSRRADVRPVTPPPDVTVRKDRLGRPGSAFRPPRHHPHRPGSLRVAVRLLVDCPRIRGPHAPSVGARGLLRWLCSVARSATCFGRPASFRSQICSSTA